MTPTLLFLTHRPGMARAGLLAALAAAALALAACGGGGDAADAGTATTGTAATAAALTEGTITGFGSIVVNGVHFDETSATVTDDDGMQHPASALKLGMRVQVDSATPDATTASARASAVRFGGQVLGPVEAVDASAGTLTVLGQGVDVSADTVFDTSLSGGLSAVTAGTVVEVHGLRDSATGRIAATRIEAESSPSSYKLRGPVAALDTTAKTFTIGGASISYAGLASTAVPSTLANGVTLRVSLATTALAGVWQASSLGLKTAPSGDRATAHLRGAITAFSSSSSFSVDGIPVDASAATFPDGTAGLALGVQVDVQGTLTNGTLVATRVALESRHRGEDDRKWQLHGQITAIDTVAKTFVVRGTTVSYAGTLTYTGGTEASLAVGVKVQVRGSLASDGITVNATTIRIGS